MLAIAPFTALHHLYFYHSYQGLASWEYGTVTAAIQVALFAAVYRYSVRQDLENDQLRNAIVMAFVLIRSLVRVHGPIQCLALPLTCTCGIYCCRRVGVASSPCSLTCFIALSGGEPFEFMDWGHVGRTGDQYSRESSSIWCRGWNYGRFIETRMGL